jgi:hypothetical protein
MTVHIDIIGLEEAKKYLEQLPDRTRKAAAAAINNVAAGSGMNYIRRGMREQIAFPPGYLEDTKRLGVTRRAVPGNLVALITGRQRPTSLARFIVGGVRPNRTGPVSVRVNPGATRVLKRAFVMRLRVGRGETDARNIGLAIRLKPGERIVNKKVMFKSDPGLYLLYGPSIDQVARSVFVEVAPMIGRDLSAEFIQQFARTK